jgi:hypothetical protein
MTHSESTRAKFNAVRSLANCQAFLQDVGKNIAADNGANGAVTSALMQASACEAELKTLIETLRECAAQYIKDRYEVRMVMRDMDHADTTLTYKERFGSLDEAKKFAWAQAEKYFPGHHIVIWDKARNERAASIPTG